MCERSPANVKKAAPSTNVFLNVDANDDEKPLSCVVLCAQIRMCQAEDCWAVQKRVVRTLGRRKLGMSSMVFSMSLTDRLFCAEISYFLNSRKLYSGSVRISWKDPSKTGALASKLLARTTSLHLQLCSLECGLHACSKVATPVSGEAKNCTVASC